MHLKRYLCNMFTINSQDQQAQKDVFPVLSTYIQTICIFRKFFFRCFVVSMFWILLACSNTGENAKKAMTNAKKDSIPTIRIDTVRYSKKDSVAYAMLPPIKSGLWDTLRDIKYTKEGVYSYKPEFTTKHKALHRKEITIQGYMHPLEGDKVQKWFMLSYYPSYACFFCAAAGPETIVEVKSPRGILYEQDKVIKVHGTLNLNYDEPERLFYILEKATLER